VGQILRKSSIFQPSVPTHAKSLHPLSLRLIHSKTAPRGKIGRKGALTPRLTRTRRNTFQHFSAVRRADFILSSSPPSLRFPSYSFSTFLDQPSPRFPISLLTFFTFLMSIPVLIFRIIRFLTLMTNPSFPSRDRVSLHNVRACVLSLPIGVSALNKNLSFIFALQILNFVVPVPAVLSLSSHFVLLCFVFCFLIFFFFLFLFSW